MGDVARIVSVPPFLARKEKVTCVGLWGLVERVSYHPARVVSEPYFSGMEKSTRSE
jgi:hypothetical protein